MRRRRQTLKKKRNTHRRLKPICPGYEGQGKGASGKKEARIKMRKEGVVRRPNYAWWIRKSQSGRRRPDGKRKTAHCAERVIIKRQGKEKGKISRVEPSNHLLGGV